MTVWYAGRARPLVLRQFVHQGGSVYKITARIIDWNINCNLIFSILIFHESLKSREFTLCELMLL